MTDESEEVNAWPIRAIRFADAEGQPSVRLLLLSSERGEGGIVHTFVVSADTLEMMAGVFSKEAKALRERAN